MKRRRFLQGTLLCALQAGASCILGTALASGCQPRQSERPTVAIEQTDETQFSSQNEARYYERRRDGSVQCHLCWRECIVQPGGVGFCMNKKNIDGTYYSLVYGHAGALQIDPIEKEPMFHMLPGSRIACIGTAGCNNRCKFCHNWHLSQQTVEQVGGYTASAKRIAAEAHGNCDALTWYYWSDVPRGATRCVAVSFTYNEPTVFYEYMYDIAEHAREKGMGAIMHTNGGISRRPLQALLKLLNAVTVDLKAFTEQFYHNVSESKLEPVLQTLETIRSSGRHLEIVNLVIPTLNDNPLDIRRMCAWIAANLGRDTPLHFTRFFPDYKLKHLPPTPVETLQEAAQIADAEGLQYVYIGNLPGHTRNSTFCPRCGKLLIARRHFEVTQVNLDQGKCPNCKQTIPGIWSLS